MHQPETGPKSKSVFVVFTRVPHQDGSTSFNPECVYDGQQAAIDCADELFRDFEGHVGVTLIEARLNEARGGVTPIYIRDATQGGPGTHG